jgi:hypothetical protein
MSDFQIAFSKEEANTVARALFGGSGYELQQILQRKFINTQGFSVDPYHHAFLAGQRSVALALCACASTKVVGAEHEGEDIS